MTYLLVADGERGLVMKAFKPIGCAARCVVLGLVFFGVFFTCPQFAAAQESNQVADPSKNKILDLVFRVDDLGGKVQDLKVKESRGAWPAPS